MRLRQALIFVSFLFVLGLPNLSRADQARDWMAGPQPGGTVLNLDVVFPGTQATIEHRVPIYGIVNELWLKANALLTLPFYESQVDVDLRLIVLSIGGSVGYRNNFRALEFAPGESVDREARRKDELGGDWDDVSNVYGEGRVQLALPFNDHALFWSVNGMRFEGGPDRIFDWRLGVPRDSGMYVNSNNTLFYKHRDIGAFGPQLQILNFAYDGVRRTQVNYGFTFTTRPGFMRKNDILFLSMLFNFDKSDGTTTGESPSDIYGTHLFFGPYNFQLAYRMVFELSGPPDDDEEDE
jgi:hypothetical protein